MTMVVLVVVDYKAVTIVLVWWLKDGLRLFGSDTTLKNPK